MKKYSLSLVFVFLSFVQSLAQFGIGGEAGLNLSNATQKAIDGLHKGETSSGRLKAGLRAGLRLGYNITPALQIQTGAYFSMKGFNGLEIAGPVTGSWSSKINARINYVEVPLNLLVFAGSKRNFYFGPGGYFARGIGGKYKRANAFSGGTFYEGKIRFGDEAHQYHFKANDYGVQLSAGYKLPLGIFIHGQFSKGLADISPNAWYYSCRNWAGTISAGWMFTTK